MHRPPKRIGKRSHRPAARMADLSPRAEWRAHAEGDRHSPSRSAHSCQETSGTDPRIDSSDLLPDELMPCLPHVTCLRSDGPAGAEERDKAGKHGNTQGVDRDGWREVPCRHSGGAQRDPGRVRGYHGLPPQARYSAAVQARSRAPEATPERSVWPRRARGSEHAVGGLGPRLLEAAQGDDPGAAAGSGPARQARRGCGVACSVGRGQSRDDRSAARAHSTGGSQGTTTCGRPEFGDPPSRAYPDLRRLERS
jgi:hypothetical protein